MGAGRIIRWLNINTQLYLEARAWCNALSLMKIDSTVLEVLQVHMLGNVGAVGYEKDKCVENRMRDRRQ